MSRLFSYGIPEISSGLHKATIIDFVTGRSNPSGTTIAAILEALEISLSEFGTYYDKITEKDIMEYKKGVETAQKERVPNNRVKNVGKKRKPKK